MVPSAIPCRLAIASTALTMSSFGRTRATTAEAALSDLPEGWNSVKFVSGSAAVAIAMSGNPQA